MGQVDVEALQRESEELLTIVQETKSTLKATGKASLLLLPFQETIIAMPQLDFLSLVISGINAVSNAIARKKVKDALLSVYEELVSKQSLIIAETQNILQEMQDKQNKSDAELRTLQKQFDQLKALSERIGTFREKVEIS